jgi:hypothetical protein
VWQYASLATLMLNKTTDLRRFFRVASLLLVLGQVTACSPETHEELRGSLFFGAGQYVAELELHNGNVKIETNLGDVDIKAISAQGDERLLVTVFGAINQQDKHRLVLYDLDTRQTLTIALGRNGHYLPGTRVLVYDDGVSLMVAERDDDGWQKTEVVRHAYNAPLVIKPLSASRFLYAIGEQAIHMYDLVSQRAVELSELGQLCRLEVSSWDPQREQLLCRKLVADGRYEYIMAELDGTVAATLGLPESRMLQPLAFLPDQDALILTERWRSKFSDRQNHAVWVFRFDTGDFYRLLDNQYLGHSVVYRPR